MKELIALLNKSKPLILIVAVCAIVIATGISWGIAKADRIIINNGTIKIELTNN